MQGHAKAAITVLLVGLLSIAGFKLFKADIEDHFYSDTTDARSTKGKIRIGVDNWVGYYPLCSKEMKRSLRKQGFLLECVDDNADYQTRMSSLDKGKLDLAVATVDAYLTSGKAYNYPATIVAVIDESKGGDAIIANKDSIDSLDDLKTPRELVLGYTANSPSEHLLRAVASHFDINTIKDKQFDILHTDGSSDALRKLQYGEVDVAVLWEPDVSIALKDHRFKRILGTEDTQKLIVDVLLASHEFTRSKPEALQLVLASYFKVLKFYRDNPQELIKELTKVTELNKKQVNSLLGGVAWKGLGQNMSVWLEGEYALVDTIESSIKIFSDFEEIPTDLIPNGDPYRLINTRPLQEVQSALTANGLSVMSDGKVNSRQFSELTNQQWQHLVEVGTLKIRPVVFSSGSNNLSQNSKVQLNDTADNLKHYPSFRIRIEGHTGTRGDKGKNRQLSQARADEVKSYLIEELGFNSSRIQSLGKGSQEPLIRDLGESNRHYTGRLKRVEISLLKETY